MQKFDQSVLRELYIPAVNSHKGDNGKVLIIGGSKLFHAASLWSLSIASKIVDMVFYSSVPENNAIVQQEKKEFRNGIVVPRGKIEDYLTDADCILIGPGLPRESGIEEGDSDTKLLTEKLLQEYPHKKWVIDGGSLQTIDPMILLHLQKTPILTPHHREFEMLFGIQGTEQSIQEMASKYHCVILLKGPEDLVCWERDCISVSGGGAGMTKGGTGDVLAGLTAALYAQNENPLLVAQSASFINKKAGESLAQKVGVYFNASDLVEEIPVVMKEHLNFQVSLLHE